MVFISYLPAKNAASQARAQKRAQKLQKREQARLLKLAEKKKAKIAAKEQRRKEMEKEKAFKKECFENFVIDEVSFACIAGIGAAPADYTWWGGCAAQECARLSMYFDSQKKSAQIIADRIAHGMAMRAAARVQQTWAKELKKRQQKNAVKKVVLRNKIAQNKKWKAKKAFLRAAKIAAREAHVPSLEQWVEMMDREERSNGSNLFGLLTPRRWRDEIPTIEEEEVVVVRQPKKKVPKWNDLTDVKKHVEMPEKPSLAGFPRLIEFARGNQNLKALVLGILSVKMRKNPEAGEVLSQIVDQLEQTTDVDVPKVQPEMDPEGVVEDVIAEASQKSDTVMTTAQVLDTHQPDVASSEDVLCSSSLSRPTFDSMTDRWLYVDRYDWKKDVEVGTSIFSLKLPDDVLRTNLDTQIAQLFMTHRFARFDMRFRLGLNSNQFQVGQVVCDSLYVLDSTNGQKNDTLSAALQRNHVKLSAGASNDAEIVVKYNHMNSMMPMNKNYQFATLNLRVLNKLIVAPTVVGYCSISLSVSFENISLAGSIDRTFGKIEFKKRNSDWELVKAEPEMMAAAALMGGGASLLNATTGLVSVLKRDANRDKPPMALQPMSFVPQSMPSLAYMTGAGDPVNMLRADPTGQCPHKLLVDEMKVSDVVGKWGFVRSVEWQLTDKGTIFTKAVTPIPTSSELTFDTATPLGFVTSFFNYWRGDVEYRFEVVGSKYHSGRLMIGSIPGVVREEGVTISKLKNSPHVVFDISNSTDLNFRVPWNYILPYCVTRLGLSSGDMIATLVVAVVNPLIVIDSVPNKAYINVYVRAADNFEVAIPRAPLFDPAYGETIKPPTASQLIPWNVQALVFISYKSSIVVKDSYPCVLNYSSGISGWVGYTNVRNNTLYELQNTLSDGITKFRVYANTSAGMKQVKYGIWDSELSSANAHGLIVYDTVENAEKALLTGTEEGHRVNALQWAADGPWSETLQKNKDGTFSWRQAVENGFHPMWIEHKVIRKADYLIKSGVVKPEMDTFVLESMTSPTQFGRSVFGEVSPDLKSLCRRFNYFTSLAVQACTSRKPMECPWTFTLRVTPVRSLDIQNSTSIDNRLRHGTITAISSMYAFWRGSLRYRFVAMGTVPKGTMIYVQHDCSTFLQSKDLVGSTRQVKNRDDYLDLQLATYGHSLDVNASFTIEVPYYQSREKSYLNPGLSNNFTDNGILKVWVMSPSQDDIHFEIFYSLADDCRFSVFQGIPSLVELDAIPDEPAPKVVEPQMDTCGEAAALEAIREKNLADEKAGNPWYKRLGESIKVAVTPKVVTDVQQSSVKIADSVESTSKNLNDLTEKFAKMTQSISDFFTNRKDHLKATVMDKGFGYFVDYLMQCKDTLFSFFSHLIYVILSPTIATVSWALMNMYHVCFGFSWDGLTKIVDLVKYLWWKAISSKRTQRSVQPEGPDDENQETSTFVSMLFAGITSLLKLKADPPTNINAVSRNMFQFSFATRNGKWVGDFFRDALIMFKRVWWRFIGLFRHENDAIKLIAGLDDERLKTWAMEAAFLLEPINREKIMTIPIWSQKLFEASLIGQSLQYILTVETHTAPRLTVYVQTLLKRIMDIEAELIRARIYCGVRYEPYVLWLTGEAGSGKSRLSNMAAEMFAETYSGIQTYFPRTGGQKYFDGYVGQPTILIDDFLSVAISADPDSYTQFLQLKSDVLFNPPYAEADKKGTLVNPRNIVVTSNIKYFDDEIGIHDVAAYNRRRDTFLELRYARGWDYTRVKRTPKSELTTWAHVDVYVRDPMNSNIASRRLERISGEAYEKTVLNYIKKEYEQYHAKQILEYDARVLVLQKRMKKVGASVDFDETLKAYTDVVTKVGTKACATNVLTSLSNWIMEKQMACSPEEDRPKLKPFFEGLGLLGKPKPEGPEEESVPSTSKQASTNPFDSDDEFDDTEQTVVETWEDYELGEVSVPQRYSSASGYPKTCVHQLFLDDLQSGRSEISDFELVIQKSSGRSALMLGPLSTMKDGNVKTLYLDRCAYKVEGELQFQPGDCILEQESGKIAMHRAILKDGTNAQILVSNAGYPDWLRSTMTGLRKTSRGTAFDYLCQRVREEQGDLSSNYVTVGDYIFKRTEQPGFLRRCWLTLLTFMKGFTEFLTNLALLVACICSIILSVMLIKALFKASEEQPTGELHPSGDYKTVKHAARTGVRAKALAMVREEDEDGQVVDVDDFRALTTDGMDGLTKKLIDNTFHLVGQRPMGDGKAMIYRSRCLGLYNKKFLVLKHYIDHFRSVGVTKVSVIYHKGLGMVTYDLDDVKFSWGPEGYGVGELPRSAPRQFANITKYMPGSNYVGTYKKQCKILEVFTEEVFMHSVDIDALNSPVIVPSNSTQEGWTITQGFEYEWGGKGKCGSLLLCPSMACPLIGIHTAGIAGVCGYAESLVRDSFVEQNERVIEFVVPQMNQDPNVFSLDGDYYQVGKIDAQDLPRFSTKTKICPSDIQGVFPVRTEPAPLDDKDERLLEKGSILRTGCSKHNFHNKPFPDELLEEAYEDYRRQFLLKVQPQRTPIQPLSIVEAIEGFPLSGYESISFSTSEGYPWSLDRPKGYSDKRWMFDLEQKDDGRYSVNQLYRPLYDALVKKEEMREQGIVPLSMFMTCLKDARIKKEKVGILGKTRVFEMSPIDLTIAGRQFFLDCEVAYNKSRFEHTIGINVDGQEWSRLANELLNFSPYIITGDYAGFGPSLDHKVLEKTFDLDIEWCEMHENANPAEKERRRMIREVIKHEVIHSPYVSKDLLWYCTSGQSCGNFRTIRSNDMPNSLYIRMAFLELARQYAPHYADMFYFNKFVLLKTNGDDLIGAVKEEAIEWFNNRTISEFFAKYRIKFTDALKDGSIREYCTLEEATYLKRGFLRHPTREGQWLAPLEITSLEDTPNWVWKDVDQRRRSLENSEMGCRLAYSQGPEYYSWYVKRVTEAWMQKKENFQAPSWQSLDLHIWEDKPGPTFSFV